MSTPLVDINANPRQPGFKQGSKIPSPPEFQRSGSKGRRSLFSVSATGSPCNTAVPPPSKAVMSPTPTSKLPRKSTPTQSTFSKSYTYGCRSATLRTSLLQSQGGHKQSAIPAPPSSNTVKLTPTLSRDKPLPSPPIAQFINPRSPPKAQRTLVDAEAGTPTEREWPILQPENASPPKPFATQTGDALPQRSVSEGSVLRRNGIPILQSRVTTPSSAHVGGRHSQESSPFTENIDSSHKKFRRMTEPRPFSSTNPYASSFHAFSTDNKVAADSPLALKRHNPPAVSIPPRVSSKRRSLPSPEDAHHKTPAQPPSAPSNQVKPGCTKWPVLEATTDKALRQQSTIEEPSSGYGQQLITEHEQATPMSSDPAPAIQSRYGPIDNISTWSLAPGSSINDELDIHYEGTVRVKRLSWHSSKPDSGPLLRIAADADAVLLGRHDSSPEVSDSPDNMPKTSSQEHSISILAKRISRQAIVRVAPDTDSRSPTSSPAVMGATEGIPVEITPIRSMQLPRKASTGDLPKECTSPVTEVPLEVEQDKDVLETMHNHVCSSSSSSEVKSASERQPSEGVQGKSYEHGNYSTILQTDIPPKAMHILGTRTESPVSVTRKRLPMSLSMKKVDTNDSKSRSSMVAAGRFSCRASTSSSRAPSSTSSNLPRSITSQTETHRPNPSRLCVTELVSTPSICSNNSSRETGEVRRSTLDIIAQKVEAKRSFRNIFHRREAKRTPQPARKPDSKPSSVAGGTLAQHIRSSSNLSKDHLLKLPDTKIETKQDLVISSNGNEATNEAAGRQDALCVLEVGSPEEPLRISPVTQYDTSTVVYNILNCVTSIGADSPDRLRGLEIAESVLHAVECSREAKMSAELARKHARDAELNAERADIGLQRLKKLCESSFDDETMQAIKELITAAGIIEPSVPAEK